MNLTIFEKSRVKIFVYPKFQLEHKYNLLLLYSGNFEIQSKFIESMLKMNFKKD